MEENKKELPFYHAFSCLGGFGPQKIKKLLTYFGTLEQAWKADYESLLASDIGQTATKNLLEKEKRFCLKNFFLSLRKAVLALLPKRASFIHPN